MHFPLVLYPHNNEIYRKKKKKKKRAASKLLPSLAYLGELLGVALNHISLRGQVKSFKKHHWRKNKQQQQKTLYYIACITMR